MSSTGAVAPEALEAARRARVPVGSTVIVVRPFESPGKEMQRALRPPWPQWMRQLYTLERLGDPDIDVEAGEVPIGAAIGALANRLRHRLELIAWVLAALEESGWEAELVGDHVVAHRIATPTVARAQLERDGIYGPMTNVCDLDELGLPLLLEAHQLR